MMKRGAPLANTAALLAVNTKIRARNAGYLRLQVLKRGKAEAKAAAAAKVSAKAGVGAKVSAKAGVVHPKALAPDLVVPLPDGVHMAKAKAPEVPRKASAP